MPPESQNTNESVWLKIAIALVPTLILSLISYGALNARVNEIEKNFSNTEVTALSTKFSEIDIMKADHEGRLRSLEKSSIIRDTQFGEIIQSLNDLKQAVNDLQKDKQEKRLHSEKTE